MADRNATSRNLGQGSCTPKRTRFRDARVQAKSSICVPNKIASFCSTPISLTYRLVFLERVSTNLLAHFHIFERVLQACSDIKPTRIASPRCSRLRTLKSRPPDALIGTVPDPKFGGHLGWLRPSGGLCWTFSCQGSDDGIFGMCLGGCWRPGRSDPTL